MRMLEDFQRAFADAVRKNASPPDSILGADAAARMDVYRRSYRANLTNALRLSYPATDRLAGRILFDEMAALFVAGEAPATGNLNIYGGGFAQFVAQHAGSGRRPYLGDVARLDWAVNHAMNAADAEPLDDARLALLEKTAEYGTRFLPHPSVSLLRSDYPVDVIWDNVLHQNIHPEHVTAAPVWLLVMREADDSIKFLSLAAGAWDFVASLCAGDALGDALGAAQGVDTRQVLGRLLGRGILVGWQDGGR